ncbi:MAG: hypothetical protein HXO13_02220 [Prevotella salivae]|jgi:hypothetical protein|nr:hypothetical protein [Segatella salivae]DAQ14373.1 MAG TPA: hypothetical protein [Caudoviricetes sp.]DAR09483.1 MAG TPA: hypothetical protein [Caudoviricetes sp.]DAY13807.1 MAG TPA: hypothetical protein [Caudoviricetes sp.]
MVRFRMFRIHTDQFAILSETAPVDFDEVGMGVAFSYKVAEDCKIAATIKLSFDTFDNGKQPLMMIEVTCEYLINEDDWKGMIKGDVLNVTKETLEYLTAQAVGVTRGILHCKTEDTPFSVLIIPPLNVAKMITSGLKASITELSKL